MLLDEFVVRLLASFGAGFAVVASVTTLADHAGEGPAGFVGGMPWTGPMSLLAIGFTQSAGAAERALTLFPLGASATIAFLLFYAFPPRMRFWRRMASALVLWGMASAAAAVLAPRDFVLSAAAALGVSLLVLYLRSRVPTDRAARTSFAPGPRRTGMRGVLGGSVVAMVVVIGMLGGPLVGGVFAAAPAVWSSTLYVTSRSQGVEFSRSLTWTFMRTGILTVIPYAVAARYFFAVGGIWFGTLCAYLTISPLAYLAWRLAGR